MDYRILIILISATLTLDIVINTKSHNEFFAIKRKGLIYNNFIFMKIDRKKRREIKGLDSGQRVRLFIKAIKNFPNACPKGTILKTTTHEIIKKRIERGEEKGIVKIIKCKKTLFPRSMFLNKLFLKRYDGILEFKRFYRIEIEIL